MILLAISTQFMLFISSAGVIQGIALAGLLYFHPKSDRPVTRFLSMHIVTISILMLAGVTQYYLSWQTIILHLSFQFLIGPLLYLYIRSFKEKITWRKAWPHFLLFIIIFITAIQTYFAWLREYPTAHQVPRQALLDPFTYVRVVLRNVQTIVYFILSRKELIRYQKSIRYLYSETSKIGLNWMKWLLNGFLLIIVLLILVALLIFFYPERFNLMVLIVTAILTPYIYFVTVRGLGQTTLWQLEPGKSREIIEKEIIDAAKLDSSIEQEKGNDATAKRLPESKISEIIPGMISLLEKDKLYVEPELTLQVLADKLGVPSYLASQAINVGLKKNFYDLVNGYRVEEAKRLLLESKNLNYTILSVGFEAGFNSKTTFHAVFKKFTGLTPTEYREKNRTPVEA